MNILRWLLSTQLKPSHKQNKNSGFTLIELLVAMLIAFLVITPLLGFMISVLNTDGQEQAKATSEQEIKAALDYITRDLQQAIYIYDATGIACLSGTVDTTCPNASTTGNQLPSPTDKVPVLVFWKREFSQNAVETKNSSDVVQFKDDSFVYSLVAYYLIKDSNPNWSKAARIARWQIKDGVTNSTGSTCSGFTEKYSRCPDIGFKPFDLSQKGITLQGKMNSWTGGGTYNQDPVVLVDFIDQTTITDETPTVTAASITCPAPTSLVFQRVPSTIVRRGFYACVNSVGADNRSAVEVYLRGNAQARLIQNDETKVRYAQSKSSYFPSANIKVQGSSFIFTK
ncbi:hormogonium polysaccharide secretion pseudopilin HpsC [Nostoc sp. ChiQUE01b]|uniref:hormogonium polysaccharide secretion pseudopilin HpsC n=1 Tax=Nostoc sp. ChiQUE01b TaxID=3075376 RepID=UPI002AD33780|nr:hormogonium polysaccharide secretion pseudopilin HpsC [Nostoc sp. ChiQUE01b]MDZ8262021.1 hormogonium polysaccharide secretion pseudopilin HpsC [Nostoc sp. ChiQUE01b]